jgi:hypothetical protein
MDRSTALEDDREAAMIERQIVVYAKTNAYKIEIKREKLSSKLVHQASVPS